MQLSARPCSKESDFSPKSFSKMPVRVESHAELGEINAASGKRGNKLDHPTVKSRDTPVSSSNPHLVRPATSIHRANISSMQSDSSLKKPSLQWDWDIEHEDRREEARADAAIHGAHPFQVDRKLLKDIVHEHMGAEVARIKFLGAGTFHKCSMLSPITPIELSLHMLINCCSSGILITLVNGREVVARVARRFMPRLKTESEVATMRYLRERTAIPVPTVYHYDSNPYNRLGGEYILMSKATGIPLSKVFHSMPHNTLIALTDKIASLIIPIFAHRFPQIGSLYDGPDPNPLNNALEARITSRWRRSERERRRVAVPHRAHHLVAILRLEPWALAHPGELNRGPWRSAHEYLVSCTEREISGVVLENEGKAAPHRLHLDPDEIHSSRHHKVTALPEDRSDTSDEWDWEESEEEWEGPGDTMYQDYRRMQRTTFLVAHLRQREELVKHEMARFLRIMERLGVVSHAEGDGGGGGGHEEFGLDLHDLNLENVFVDEQDNSKVVNLHHRLGVHNHAPIMGMRARSRFLQSSPFTAKVFRATVERMARHPRAAVVNGVPVDLSAIAADWLHHEAAGARLRMAHRCIEWDGWEEGLVESILGPEEQEDDWFDSWAADSGPASAPPDTPPCEEGRGRQPRGAAPAKVVAVEKEKERLLNATGDICGGRGGELGRRLEAWLYVNGDADGRVGLGRRWEDGEEPEGAPE
ncbi:hypothetical protein A0H81_02388 [Grifola frondosa]|uniref:Aminoglycoside phosphotransferase domain-containing protein n=1 Tax=Grifola frondosa TaxID=5627 RepID=A0A1C7MLM5_GRIFR|nr:hypothetical protein A0H81_02388 [Grifola frondosa]